MAHQSTATTISPAPHAAPQRLATVRSIEHARRGRSRPATPPGVIRVLIVGNHALTRAGLRRLLDDDAGLAVIGEAANGDEAARELRSAEPDVLLLDAGCRELDPADLTRALSTRVAVLLLTDCESCDTLLAALRAGATGVLPKDSHPAHLASAVRTVASGGALLPAGTTRRLIRELVKTPSIPGQ